MHDPAAFAKLVPGFDFLQNLTQSAGASMPAVGHWIAPTLDPQDLEKRIEELRTVQFWLEQNARMLGATIQALEVQRMTLSTLKTMNVSLGDLTESLKIRLPETPPSPAAEPGASARAAAQSASSAEARPAKPARKPAASEPGTPQPAVPPGVIDPMKWWGALTQQFTELATQALKETSAAAGASEAVGSGAPAAGTSAARAAGKVTAKARASASGSRRPAAKGGPR